MRAPRFAPHRRSVRTLSSAIFPAFLLVACGQTAPPPSPVAPPPPASTEAKTPPAPTGLPTDDAPPAPAPTSAFRKVGILEGEAQIFGREPGSAFLAIGLDVVAIASGDAVTLHPELHQRDDFALRSMSQLTSVTKGAGDNVWGAWIFPEGRMGATLVERFDGKKWSGKSIRSRNAHVVNQLFDLGNGRIVAIEEPQMGPYSRTAILAVEGPKTGLPQVSKRPGPLPPNAPEASSVWFVPVAVVPGKDGGTHLIGNSWPPTDADIGKPMIESFDAKGKSKGHAELDLGVTDKSATVGIFAHVVPGGRLVLGVNETVGKEETTTFRLVQGGGEKPVLVPIRGLRGAPVSLAADRQGNLYALTATHGTTALFRIAPDGEAIELTLPDELTGTTGANAGVMATSADDVWLLVPQGGRTFVYRTKKDAPALAELTLPNPQEAIYARQEKKAAAAEARRLVFAKAWTKSCETPFVLLYTLAKTAPADYDFPSTRDAIKGHPELAGSSFVEFSRGGKRFFGAAVPSGAIGQKLVDAVKGKVPGSTPQLVCDAPTPERTLTIDLVTGKIVP